MKYRSVMMILNYNDMKVTEKLARSVIDYECPDRVIIVDNCSPDGSYDRLRDAFKKSEADVIKTSENGGYAKGNNFGIRYAIEHYDPEYIFVANPDIAVSEKTLANMLKMMDKEPDYAVMAPLVRQGYNVWKLPGFAGMIESLFLVWFNLDKRRIKKKLIASGRPLADAGVVEGSFFVIRTEDYLKAGGFDERTFLYAEEIILAKRLKDAGKKVGVLPDERYDHMHSASIKKEYASSKCRAFPNFYKSFRIYNKYYLHTNAVQDMIFYICYGLAYFERFIYDRYHRVPLKRRG
ncbi:MAG: glycosyltransferase family 2 protein [Lachnospiraceae bacterium]|nr:glycosyltransferase family 2 protein [Lachnospiraceae bacterium]